MAFNFHLTCIFLLLASGITGIRATTNGNSCKAGLDHCGPPGECNMRCQWSYPGSEGRCDDTPFCTCHYNCSRPASPVPTCNEYAGSCSLSQCGEACCIARCQAKFPGPATTGFCQDMGGPVPKLCLCTYNC